MRTIVSEPDLGEPFLAQPIPADTSWDTIGHVLRWEADLRTNRRCLDLGAQPSGSYWQQVLLLLEAYRQVVHQPEEPIEVATLDALSPAHRWLVTHRWPERIAAARNGEGLLR